LSHVRSKVISTVLHFMTEAAREGELSDEG